MKFLEKMAANIGIEFLDDRDGFRNFFEGYLDDLMGNISPIQFEQMFENDFSLVSLIDRKFIEEILSGAKEAEIDLQRARKVVSENMPYFDENWAINWLKKEHKEFYYRVATHQNPNLFLGWITRQISDIKHVIMENLK